MDPLGSEGTPGLLCIGTSQGHFCGGYHSLQKSDMSPLIGEPLPEAWLCYQRLLGTLTLGSPLYSGSHDGRNKKIQVFCFRMTQISLVEDST